MSSRWNVAIAAIVLLAVYSVGVTWYSASHSADLEARLAQTQAVRETPATANTDVPIEKSEPRGDLVAKQNGVLTLNCVPTESIVIAERYDSGYPEPSWSIELREKGRALIRSEDRDAKLSGNYQRRAQDLIDGFFLDTINWGGNLQNEEYLVFGVDFMDVAPTIYSARWSMLRYDSEIEALERYARESGRYYEYGNLGDMTLRRLEHVVAASQCGIVSRHEADWRIDRMERYVRPGDTNSIKLLSALRTSLTQ